MLYDMTTTVVGYYIQYRQESIDRHLLSPSGLGLLHCAHGHVILTRIDTLHLYDSEARIRKRWVRSHDPNGTAQVYVYWLLSIILLSPDTTRLGTSGIPSIPFINFQNQHLVLVKGALVSGNVWLPKHICLSAVHILYLGPPRLTNPSPVRSSN